MNKLKKGLTYISERGSFYRYSDKDYDEKWLQPLSEYIPLEAIMRGQPVSIATNEDIRDAANRLADNNEELSNKIYNTILQDSHTFVVLTRPERHKNTIGLSYEYMQGPSYNIDEEELILNDKIHILDSGKFDIDPDYLLKSHQVNNKQLLLDVINKEEYLPDFFKKPYTSLIGQQIYVKGNDAGKLTIVPEEAYIGYNNIIKIGFISDAWINGNNIDEVQEDLAEALAKKEDERTPEEKKLISSIQKDYTDEDAKEYLKNSVTIQVQIQGDDRGALDSTLFEGTIGESVIITEDNPVRVFALGQEDNVAFKARINITPSTTYDIDKETAFIGFQKMDGKTVIVSFGENFSIVKAKDAGITEDAAFLTIANIYDPKFYETCKPHVATYINNIGTDIQDTQNSLANAIKAAWKELTDTEMNVEQLTSFKQETTAGYLEIESSKPGGYYYMYISENLHRIFLQDSYTITNGSSNNKGYVVLADNRIAARQNIIGIYNSGIYGEQLEGRRCIFMHDGLFRHNAEDGKYQEIGKEYFLGRNGFVTRIPDTAYETVVKVFDVQDSEKLLIHCDNMRVKTRGGDLPLGYTKPAVKVGDQFAAEYGFVLMDGVTPYDKDAYKALYERLQAWYPKSQLDAIKDTDPANSFIIPLCTTVTENGGERTLIQIKAQEYGLYEKEPRVPYIRKVGTFETEAENKIIIINGKDYLPGNCVPTIGKYSVKENDKSEIVEVDTRFEITPICDLCIMENNIQEPSIENLDIRLFVDPEYDPSHDVKYHWVEIRNGFQNFNNNTTYGFEWKLDKEDATNDCPFGRYFLSTDIKDGMGIYYQKSGNLAPTRLSGMPWKLVVRRRETVAQQYDLDGVMHAYLRNRVEDEEGKAYTTKAVTGAAVIDAIENRYYVKNLVARPHLVDDEGNVTQSTHILLGRENEPATEVALSSVEELKIHGVNGIKFENTTKEGPYKEDHKIVVKDNWISVEKGHDENNKLVDLPKFADIKGNEFTTKDQVLEHITKDATLGVDATRDDNTKVVHGLIFGPRGNVNASTFNGLPLGTHHSARVIAGGTIAEPTNNEDHPSYLSYIYYGLDPISRTGDAYLTNSEGKVVHNRPKITDAVGNAISGIYSVTGYEDKVNTDDNTDSLTYEEKINNNYSIFYNKVTGQYRGSKNSVSKSKTLEIKYNFNTITSEATGDDKLTTPSYYDFEFLKKLEGEDEAPASIKVGAIGITSNAKFKRIFGESKNKYSSTTSVDTLIGDNSKDYDVFEKDNGSKEYLGSALQAAYEMPIAYWQYISEPKWYKKYIGIVIERINDMRDNLSTSTSRTIFNNNDQKYWAENGSTGSTKPFNSNDNTYHYNEDEIKSISTYLNAVTDNAEGSQNVISSIGLLLKAAKETQERLLKVEASTFGADAPTIPGQTKKFLFPETPDVTPEATHLGLNRLIRAMAIELYGTANPDDEKLGEITESNNTSTTLSRIDTLEAEIEGKTFDEGVDTDAADNVLTTNSATYPYAVNEETSHGGITTTKEIKDVVYIPVNVSDLTYKSVLHNTTLTITDEDVLYYKNKNDVNNPYIVYTGDKTNISIPDDGDELYIKETFVKVLDNQNPLDGRAPIDGESEDSENHGTWTKINFNKQTSFEQVDGKFIADTEHNLVPETERDKFNGTIDAISRICTKVNALTYIVNGKDNINSTPERLNTIRNNIETLIKEAYFDGAPETIVTEATENAKATAITEDEIISQAYIDEDLDHTDKGRTLFHQPSQPYELKKAHDNKGKDYTGISRFDQLSKDLYDYVIKGFDNSKNTVYTNVNSEENGKDLNDKRHTAIQYTSEADKAKGTSKTQVLAGRTFNGKQLLIDGISDSSGANVTSFNQTKSDANLPTTFHLNVPDSIEEYKYASIIDILIDAIGTGYFRYQIEEDSSTTSKELRPTETLTKRIEQIEKALDNVAHKLSQKKFFEGDTTKNFDDNDLFEGNTGNPTYSIEAFINNLNKWLGLSTISNTESTWDQSISAEVACGYEKRETGTKNRYYIVNDDRTEYVDNNSNFQKVLENDIFYVIDSTTKVYKKATAEDLTSGRDLFVKRTEPDDTDYLNNADAIVNSNYVIKQLLKRLRKEESYYTILTEILGKDFDIENAKGQIEIVIDPKTGLQKIKGSSEYTLTDDIKDLLLTIYGTDDLTSRNGVQTTYEHRSNIGTNSFIDAHCWKKQGSDEKAYTSVVIGIDSKVWKTPAFAKPANSDAEVISTISTISNDKNTITLKNGNSYTRYPEGDVHETSNNNNTRFTGNEQARNIIDDILKESYFIPDPVKYESDEISDNTDGNISKTYKNTTTRPEDSKDVKYTNNTYYDFDSGKYHYDYEHNSDDIRGGGVGKAIGYQNRNTLFQDYKGVESDILSSSGVKNDAEYRRSRFEVLEDEIRHLRSFLGLNEIIDDNTIGNKKAAETVYGGHFYGTSDTSLAGHKFSGDATRNGNFFEKSNAAATTTTSADSNLLTMVFNLSNALRDISRELGKETNYHGQMKSKVNGVTLDYTKFDQLNKEREMTIYDRLNSLEDITGSLLGWVNKKSSQGGESEFEDDNPNDGTLNIQWI